MYQRAKQQQNDPVYVVTACTNYGKMSVQCGGDVHEYAERFKARRNTVGILDGPGLLTSVQVGQHT